MNVEEHAAFWAEARATMGTTPAITMSRLDSGRLAGSLKDGLTPDESWDDVL